MVNIVKIDNKNIEVDNKNLNIDEYNKSYNTGWATIKKASYGNIKGLDDSFFNSFEKSVKKNYDWLFGSLEGEIRDGKFVSMPGSRKWVSPEKQLEEIAKNKELARNLYADFNRKIQGDGLPNNKSLQSISPTWVEKWDEGDNKERIIKVIEANNKIWDDNLTFWKSIISLAEQLRVQRDETGQKPGYKYVPPKESDDREERNEKWDEINKLRESISLEIDATLSSSPSVDSSELEKPNWKDLLGYARSKTEIENLKKEILADISAKRGNKQDNKKPVTGQDLKNLARGAIYEIDTERNKDENTDLFVTWEELEINNPDWRKKIMEAAEAGDEKKVKNIKVKVLVDLRFKKAQKKKDEDAWQKVKNGSVEEMNESQLAAAVQAFEKREGDKEYERGNDYQLTEDKLIEKNPELYKEMVIEALKLRLKDNNLDEAEFTKLEQDYRKLVNKEIEEIEEFKRIKNEVGKRIGEEGAKSKWDSLFNRAKTLITKAKEKATEKVKDDIEAIQKQMNDLKSNTNAYLASFYKNEKSKVESMEKDLSSCLNTQTNPPKETPWGVIIPISLVVIALIGAAVVIVRRRKQAR